MPKPVTVFIAKLYELTHEYVSESGDECFAWNEDGTHFWVSNVEIFSRDVLPNYFKHNNYASFIRQLNIYGVFFLFVLIVYKCRTCVIVF